MVNLHFSEIECNTDVGIYKEEYRLDRSIGFDKAFTDATERGFGKTKKIKKPGQAEAEDLAQQIIIIKLFSSNNKVIYTRKYTKIIDVLSGVGGISEIFLFAILLMYTWYNSYKMEQSLLNHGVLGKEDDVKDYEPWEKSRFFSFFELVKFNTLDKLLFWVKKSKKRELYENSKDIHAYRTDVVKIMKNISELNALRDAVCLPYQKLLMNYLEFGDENDGKYIPAREAIRSLNNRRKK